MKLPPETLINVKATHKITKVESFKVMTVAQYYALFAKKSNFSYQGYQVGFL